MSDLQELRDKRDKAIQAVIDCDSDDAVCAATEIAVKAGQEYVDALEAAGHLIDCPRLKITVEMFDADRVLNHTWWTGIFLDGEAINGDEDHDLKTIEAMTYGMLEKIWKVLGRTCEDSDVREQIDEFRRTRSDSSLWNLREKAQWTCHRRIQEARKRLALALSFIQLKDEHV